MSGFPHIYPLEWHPAYRDKTWLLDWLNGDTNYGPQVKVPMVRPLTTTAADFQNLLPETVEMSYHVLTKHQMAAWAPYVGQEFGYVWTIAVDELGRGIASDSQRWYYLLDNRRRG